MKWSFQKKKESVRKEFDNISNDLNYIFIHIPKNAGTAISKSLQIETSRHYTVKEYIDMLGEKKYNSMYSFAFIRNPFSRFVSLYNYARMEESYYHSSINPDKAIYGKHMDYDTLKNASLEAAATLLVEGKLLHNPPHNQWKPQATWLKDHQGELNVKYLGRFEDIALHARNIHKNIGTITSPHVPKINTSSIGSDDYRKIINSNTRSMLESYYQEDLDTFNYDF